MLIAVTPKRVEITFFLFSTFSGCVTSAFFGKGKATLWKLFQKRQDLRGDAVIFNKLSASQETIAEAGECVVLDLYGASHSEKSINHYR